MTQKEITKGIEVRDRRNGDWLWIHKCVVECWAKIIEPQGVTLYCLLANSDFNQEHPGVVYPSQKKMAEVLGWSRQTINKWIQILEKHGLIAIEKRSRYYLIYILNKVKCPNHKDGFHRDVAQCESNVPTTNSDVKQALHLTRCQTVRTQMSNSVNSDVKQRDTNKNKEEEEKNKNNNIYMCYKEKINKLSRLTPLAEKKIALRLKEFTKVELLKAIENFSRDSWWMKNNAHRGIAWFFHSQERIEQFINMPPRLTSKRY